MFAGIGQKLEVWLSDKACRGWRFTQRILYNSRAPHPHRYVKGEGTHNYAGLRRHPPKLLATGRGERCPWNLNFKT
jgi:hypothetical protein